MDLLKAWRAGDERAGELLVTRHYAAIERFFVNKAHDHASDLLQRTFLTLVEVQERIDERRDLRRYLFGIARNVLLNHVRSVHRDGERLDFGTRSIQDLSPTPNTLLLESQRSQRLLEALRRIPLELQIVLELYYWEDLTAAELSTLLEIPQGSVRTKIRIAKEKLAREMTRLAPSPNLEPAASNLDSWARAVREQLVGTKPGEAGA
ncbi:MAG: sigma-70 family RNA polymerase sigma factor [Myxococcota bacterium]